MRSSKLIALSYEVPSKSLTHKELKNAYGDEQVERIASSTGIYNRRICSDSEIGSDLALRCAERILSSSNIDRQSIDLLIVTTQMPDYLLPTTACILQDKLGLSKSCAAFDINLGCSQFVYAHSVAHSMISSGLVNKALVITFDTPSKIIDRDDLTVSPLFGDGATASVLEACNAADGYQSFCFGTDGSEHQALIWKGSGMRGAINDAQMDRQPMTMHGQKVFLFTLQVVPKYISALLEKNNLSISDVDFFALHQASGLIVDSVTKKLHLEEGQFNRVYSDYGNSGGSTVGISLWHGLKSGQIQPNSKIVMSAFGVGLSWANSLYFVGDELPALY